MFNIFLLKKGYEIQIKLLLNNHQNMTLNLHVQINSVIRIHHIYKCIHNNLMFTTLSPVFIHVPYYNDTYCKCGGDASCMEDTPPPYLHSR